jgi:hypothetical protein
MSRPGHADTRRSREEEEEEEEEEGKGACSLARAGLSSYLYRLCVMCVHLSMLGAVFTPPQYLARLGSVATSSVPSSIADAALGLTSAELQILR